MSHTFKPVVAPTDMHRSTLVKSTQMRNFARRLTVLLAGVPLAIVDSASVIASGGFMLSACANQPNGEALAARLQPTCASVDVLHAAVTVRDASGATLVANVAARIERDGSIETAAAGRAIVRTDDGLEVRLSGDTVVKFRDSVGSLERGKIFVSSWGAEERTIRLGENLTVLVSDASLELERSADGTVRAIGVRGEVGWRSGTAQGRLSQGQMLSGRGEYQLLPAPVWDDWTGGAASPQGVAFRGAQGAGVAVMHAGVGESPTQLTTKEHRVTVRVDGDSATTHVAQTFFNGGTSSAPVEYRIRVPDGAMVSDFGYTMIARDGSTRYSVGFAAAPVTGMTAEGRSALLRNPDGSLFARLESVAPGDAMQVNMHYVQWLHREQGRRLYTYPVGDPSSPPFVGEFLFEMRIDRGGVGAIRGPVGSMTTGHELLRIVKSDYRPRGDVVVELFDAKPAAATEVSARIWRSRIATDGAEYAMVDLSVPPPQARGTDVVLVVDDSSATDRGALSTASAAVNAMLQTLGPDDRVMLLFGDLRARPAEGSAGQLGAVDDAKRRAILEAISQVRPAGATDLGRILSDAYEKIDPRRNGVVVYLGDSMPTMGTLDPVRLVDEVLRVAPDLRLYCVAMGADAHPEVLGRLAERGGLSMRARDQAEAVLAAQRVIAHATRPVLRDVSVSLGSASTGMLPANIEQWVVGDPLRVYGPLTDEPPRSVTIRARDAGAMRTWTVTPTMQSISDEGDLRRRWANARLEALANGGAPMAALADLGVRFSLLTQTSALVMGATRGDSVGIAVAQSAWPEASGRTRLPSLGVGDTLEPRGIRTLFQPDDYPTFTDDEGGWQPHSEDEGTDGSEMLDELIGLAEPEAQACVARARSARPALAGSLTVIAKINADGRLSNIRLQQYSSLGDAGAEACILRALSGLHVPRPELFDATPAEASYTFQFYPEPARPRGVACPATSRLDRDAKVVLWRERMISNAADASQQWNQAFSRCELRLWEDRAAMIDLLVRQAGDGRSLGTLRNQLPSDAAAYLDRVVSRRFGPSALWRAYLAGRGHINWGALIKLLAKPEVSVERKIEVTQAYVRVAPYDIDVRLKLMALYEQANRRDEARHMGELLRRDPWADSRVRALVGETLIRLGDREEGLRVFSEIAEQAPYDTNARGRLGDLLLTYGGQDNAEEAYRQFRTLVALRPGEPIPVVRMGLAALNAGREDEALRIFRAAAEDLRGDETAASIEALIVLEVARMTATRASEPAVQTWQRVSQLFDLSRQGGVVARWSHPDAGIELRAMPAGDSEFDTVGAAGALKVRVFSPGTALEGSRLVVRAPSGVAGKRAVTVRLTLVRPTATGLSLIERAVTVDAQHRAISLVVRGGQLLDDTTPLPTGEAPTASGAMY
jgi:Flp pilus assembly protein TadD